MSLVCALLTAAALAAPNDAPAPAKQVLAIRAKTVHLGDGRVLEDGVVVVEGGVIRRVGKGIEVPEGAHLVESEGVLTPGLVALHSYDGGGSELFDSTRAVMPDADSSAAFDPTSKDFQRCVAAGVTSLVLSPPASSLVPGTTTVVKTSGGRVVKRQAQLVLGFSASALSGNSFPTSYNGALGELVRLFEEPTGLVARAASGDLPVLADARTRDEIGRALAFAQRFHLKGALYGSEWTEELVQAVQRSGFAIVCGPADPGASSRGLRSIQALAKANVRFGFGLDAPWRSPDSLRFAAALAVRAGLEPERAVQALTGDAAAIAGVPDRVGRIEEGRDADLVLWSGDPIDLRSSVEAVYVDGRRVEGGDE